MDVDGVGVSLLMMLCCPGGLRCPVVTGVGLGEGGKGEGSGGERG